jgi:hypothetical protein
VLSLIQGVLLPRSHGTAETLLLLVQLHDDCKNQASLESLQDLLLVKHQLISRQIVKERRLALLVTLLQQYVTCHQVEVY